MIQRLASVILVVCLVGVGWVSLGDDPTPEAAPADPTLGLPGVVTPADNPITPEKVDLGRELFFDKRLSVDNTISCATCHDPNYGFSDPHPVSIGVKARAGDRNSMTVLNAGLLEPLMWDGRAASLEDQVLLSFKSQAEFDFPVEKAVEKLRRQGYETRFDSVFEDGLTVDNLCRALATYVRTLVAGDSPFDRYLFLDQEDAIGAAAKRGFQVFLDARCDQCHLIMTKGLHPFGLSYVLFTDNKFHNLGVEPESVEDPDPGRYVQEEELEQWRTFRTPSLRNVALTAPYFHDGSARTLREVVDHYDKGGNPSRNLDPSMRELELTDQEKEDLVAFLESLTSHHIPELRAEERRAEESKLARMNGAKGGGR